VTRISFLSLFILCIVFTGCTSPSLNDDEIDHGYVYTVEIDGVDYGFTGEQVPIDHIGRKIGVKPVSCHIPECPAPSGDLFYEIKTIKGKKAVAVQDYGGNVYYRCVKIN
jgi:hypothetical protein